MIEDLSAVPSYPSVKKEQLSCQSGLFFRALIYFFDHAFQNKGRIAFCLAKWVCLFSFFLTAEPLVFESTAKSAILLNPDSGAVLYEKNSDTLVFPASTTKIATAIVALRLKREGFDDRIVASNEMLVTLPESKKKAAGYKGVSYILEPDGSSIGLKSGEELTYKDLLFGMLICSGNDASNVIADTLGPTVPLFMEKVNSYLKEIGCTKTHFCNPHGLHDPLHQTTARELALLMKAGLKDPLFVEMLGKARFERPKTNKQPASTHVQTDALVRPGPHFYPKAIGGKTGYHSKAKNTYVGAAKFNDRTLIVVLTGVQERSKLFKEATSLYELAFNQPKVRRTYLESGEQPFTLDFPDAKGPLLTELKAPLCFDYYPAENPHAKCFLSWDLIQPPIQKGEKVGTISLVDREGKTIQEASLLAVNDVELKWYKRLFSGNSFWILLIAGALLVSVLILVL